ncbi:MAG: hypothetical protein FGM16_01120 [Flavobacterium sp.]|nr:hypothetical protein [Flavobacterium sp.]
MKSLVKNSILFLVPLVIILLLLEIFLRSIDTSYSEKKKGLVANDVKVELLILGNSHSTYGINPNAFDLYAYNMANVNQSLYFDKRITLKHLNQLPNLKYVLIGIDYHSLYFSDQKIRNIWSYYDYGIDYKNQLSFTSKNSRIKGYTLKVALTFIKRKYSGNYQKIKAIDVEDGVDLNQPIQKGWFSFVGTEKGLMNEKSYGSTANLFNYTVKNSTEKTEIISNLEDFIGILKKRNITPILVTTPCYEPYKKLLSKKYLDTNQADVKKLTEKYQIAYWNYFDLPLDQSCFHNCDHLNGKGAAIFSKMLNSRLKSIK